MTINLRRIHGSGRPGPLHPAGLPAGETRFFIPNIGRLAVPDPVPPFASPLTTASRPSEDVGALGGGVLRKSIMSAWGDCGPACPLAFADGCGCRLDGPEGLGGLCMPRETKSRYEEKEG